MRFSLSLISGPSNLEKRHRQHQPSRQSGGRAAAQGNAEMANNRFKPECAPGRSAGHRLAEPLCKNPSWATGGGATKSANRDPELNSPTMRRQVEEPPLVATVHPSGLPAAGGAFARGGAAPSGDDDAIWSDLDVIDQQPCRRQRPKLSVYHG